MTVLYNKAARIFAGLIFQLIFLLSLQAQKRSAVTLESIIDSAQHHLPVLLEKHALLNSAEAAKKFRALLRIMLQEHIFQ